LGCGLALAALVLLGTGQSLSVAAPIVLTGTTNAKYSYAAPADNTIFDATAWTSTAVAPGNTGVAAEIGPTNITSVGPKNITWKGGVIHGAIPTSWSWRMAHDDIGGAGVIIHNNTFAEWQFLRVHNVEDGMKPREAPEWTGGGNWLLRDCYFTAIRDDCIENDRFEPGTVQDCLFDGVHTFMSEQEESGFPQGAISIHPGESDTIYVKRVYIRIYPTNAFDAGDDQYPGGGKWFKWSFGAQNAPHHNVRVEDSVFAVGTIPRSGWGNLDIPSQVTWVGANNFILWLGSVGTYGGPMPGVPGDNVPTSVTFLEGTAAKTKWQEVRNQWLTGHGLPSQGALAADYNPHNLTTFTQIPTTTDTTPPAAPTGLTAMAGNAQVTLDWTDNPEPDLAGYNVYRSTTSGGPFATPLNNPLLTASNYTDNSAANGTTYYYVATAADASANESVDSAQVSATPTAPNTAPTISNIVNQTINMNGNTGALAFTVGDAETAAGSLVPTKGSNNPTLVPTANIVFGGSGANRTVTVTPAAGLTGTATITVTVTDGGSPALSTLDDFTLTVNASGTPTVYDASALTVAASSGDTKDSVSNTGASNGNFLRYKANAVGDYITFNVSVPTTATYAISVRYAKLAYGGKCQLAVDGANQGTLSDLYAASTTLASFSLGSKSLTAGTHTFKFTSTSKNASSSGYYIGIDTITLTPQ
jgi:fibronectin type 3 domain-containing protein